MSQTRPGVFLIAAVARNGALGLDGQLPWRLPSDLRHFRAATWGKPLLMGRKTYASIGRPLPGRDIVVVTRDPAFAAAGVLVARGIDEGLRLAAERAAASGADSIAVAGGGEIYAATLPLADRLAITEVDLAPEADTFFPSIDPSVWRQVRRECGVRAAGDKAEFVFVDYVRR